MNKQTPLSAPIANPAPSGGPDPLAELLQRLGALVAEGQQIGRRALRTLFEEVFCAPEGPGSWDWRLAQDLVEAAIAGQLAIKPAMTLAEALAPERLMPPASHRSEDQVLMQQFSTPPAVAVLAARACALRPGQVVLEPSAGTGLLAAQAQAAGADLRLNERDPKRAALAALALRAEVTLHDAIRIADLTGIRADRVLMNPPFTTSDRRRGKRCEWADHLASAWTCLKPGGRLVAILPAKAFARGAEDPHLPTGAWLRAAIALPRSAFRASGTTMPVRLVVLDSGGGADEAEGRPVVTDSLGEVEELLSRLPMPCALPELAGDQRAARGTVTGARPRSGLQLGRSKPKAPSPARTIVQASRPSTEVVTYHGAPEPGHHATHGLYQPWRPAITVSGAKPHPTPLVVSSAMAAICPPVPDVEIRLPAHVLSQGLLSDAQAETLVLASGAFARDLPGAYTADPETGAMTAVPDGVDGQGARYRQGFFLGDGTGVGKGRQVAALFLTAQGEGVTRGIWISKSDTLIEDARRDWQALGGDPRVILAQSAWKPDAPITALSGIIFTTYATLRQEGRGDTPSRLDQLVAWAGLGFDGVIAFDEAHAMANAQASRDGPQGRLRQGSKQGLAGIRLQARLARARVVYVSATGASAVAALAFAPRLGLWGASGTAFADARDFIAAMEAGGVATLEMICRDLARLGLYQARALSFEGVEYAPLEHKLTPRDIATWDAWAEAFLVLHKNLDAALKATGVLDGDGACHNGAAKGAALSAFESMKQRFFGQLLMAMKMPALIAAIAEDLEDGRAAVVQIVSTSEAVLGRAVAALSAEEIAAGEIEVSPADLVMDYVAASFPVTAMSLTIDADGREIAEPIFDAAGHPVISREAARLRDAFLERLGTLPEIGGAIDTLIAAFGADAVAECTGRSQRLLPDPEDPGRRRVVRRPAGANSAAAARFQEGAKQILVFSEAGGTGRSYHADLAAGNQRRRVHYLLEPGWRADIAIQGLGRTHRSNQAMPPVFRPVTTDVKGERRFLSTIARRLDALGALTRGQRETGGQNMFRAEDNLESPEAAAALRIFFTRLARGETRSVDLATFIEITGLDRILDANGGLSEDLPPMRRFLNRLLALKIDMQNRIFDEFFAIVAARVEAARQAGTLDLGIETLRADSLAIAERRVLATDPGSGASTDLVVLERRHENRVRDLGPYETARERGLVRAFVNARSGRAALAEAGPMLVHEDGRTEATIRLMRPFATETVTGEAFDGSHWELATDAEFDAAWAAEVDAAPEYQTDRITMVTGLLLPHWHLLPDEDVRVRRAVLDDGQVLLGRIVRPQDITCLCRALGAEVPAVCAADVMESLRAGAAALLGQGRSLRRATIAGGQRIELTGAEPRRSRLAEGARLVDRDRAPPHPDLSPDARERPACPSGTLLGPGALAAGDVTPDCAPKDEEGRSAGRRLFHRQSGEKE
ncbi:MAG: strawberry notch family protein [Pseudomonadota bacterium]